MGCFWKPIFKFFQKNFAAILQVAATALLCSGPTAPICAGVIAFTVTGVTSGNLGLALRAGFTAAFTAAAMDAVGTATLGQGHPLPEFMSPAHVANMAGHALVGCMSAVVGGARCGPGALAGAAGSLAAPLLGRAFPNPRGNTGDLFGGTVASAVVGGVASVAGGGKFANGAVTAAFGYLFNEMNHSLRRGWGDPRPDLRDWELVGSVSEGSALSFPSLADRILIEASSLAYPPTNQFSFTVDAQPLFGRSLAPPEWYEKVWHASGPTGAGTPNYFEFQANPPGNMTKWTVAIPSQQPAHGNALHNTINVYVPKKY
jgi:hypothetical protein